MEELVQDAGYKLAIVILFLTPLIWSLPTGLMVGELAAALPAEGGFYVWVRRAMGPFWGFQEAWLSLVASIFDMAIYPTVFVLYLGTSLAGSNRRASRRGDCRRNGFGLPAVEPSWRESRGQRIHSAGRGDAEPVCAHHAVRVFPPPHSGLQRRRLREVF